MVYVACEKGLYMDNLERPGLCQRCPPHTTTLTKASTNRRQCLCEKGYDGPSGGPCRGMQICLFNLVIFFLIKVPQFYD